MDMVRAAQISDMHRTLHPFAQALDPVRSDDLGKALAFQDTLTDEERCIDALLCMLEEAYPQKPMSIFTAMDVADALQDAGIVLSWDPEGEVPDVICEDPSVSFWAVVGSVLGAAPHGTSLVYACLSGGKQIAWALSIAAADRWMCAHGYVHVDGPCRYKQGSRCALYEDLYVDGDRIVGDADAFAVLDAYGEDLAPRIREVEVKAG